MQRAYLNILNIPNNPNSAQSKYIIFDIKLTCPNSVGFHPTISCVQLVFFYAAVAYEKKPIWGQWPNTTRICDRLLSNLSLLVCLSRSFFLFLLHVFTDGRQISRVMQPISCWPQTCNHLTTKKQTRGQSRPIQTNYNSIQQKRLVAIIFRFFFS